ncbi:hypothetical protein OSCI_3080033 [Kamptonema sp. PCC 6506]|nr:hypothetical protein OSCI_3080033 [Kamptonema sp. PCC 6506]
MKSRENLDNKNEELVSIKRKNEQYSGTGKICLSSSRDR